MTSVHDYDTDNTTRNTGENPDKAVSQIIDGTQTNENFKNTTGNSVQADNDEVPNSILVFGKKQGESGGNFENCHEQ